MTNPANATLAATLWPAGQDGLARACVLVLAGSLLLWLSAKVQLPFWPVPMTMQTFVVVMLGATLGPRLGTAAVLLYLAEGAAGLPVFAGTPEKGSGLAYMAGPTGGYLVGFVAAAWLAGWLTEQGADRSIAGMLAVAALGHAVIFACGWGWLAGLIGPAKAWAGGVAPFYLATLLKTALAGLLLPALWTLLAR